LRHRSGLAEDRPEIQAAEGPEHGEHRQDDTKIANPVGDESLLGCVGIGPRRAAEGVHLEPKADEQEGAQPQTSRRTTSG
jgi:hypothetical protein